jgi:hypothetical protein
MKGELKMTGLILSIAIFILVVIADEISTFVDFPVQGILPAFRGLFYS